MRIFRQKSGFVWLVLAALLCSSAVPSRVFADEQGIQVLRAQIGAG